MRQGGREEGKKVVVVVGETRGFCDSRKFLDEVLGNEMSVKCSTHSHLINFTGRCVIRVTLLNITVMSQWHIVYILWSVKTRV